MNNSEITSCLKHIAHALELTRRDVADIVTLGGVDTSASAADKWLRSSSATKNATGNSDIAGQRINRAGEMTSTEFIAFCAGLKSWLISRDESVNN